MIDTSVLVAGLVQQHEHHDVARKAMHGAVTHPIPGIVLAETWSVLRRRPFELSPSVVATALAPWSDPDLVLATPATAYVHALETGESLRLGGNVHDFLVLLTCRAHGIPEVSTLDRRQASLAKHLDDLSVRVLLDHTD